MKTKTYPPEALQNVLPSRFNLGNEVKLNFGSAGTVSPCVVTKVALTQGKIFYDVYVMIEVKYEDGEPRSVGDEPRLHNIDSFYVEPLN